MTKVVKIYLICKQKDKEGNEVDYKEIYKWLWDLQRQTRELKNKVIQYCWEWNNFQSDYYKLNEKYPKDKDVLGYTLGGYIYDKVKDKYNLNSGNLSTTTADVQKSFKNAKVDMIKGDKSIIEYKSDQPIDIHNKSIRIWYDNGYYVKISLLNKKKFNDLNLQEGSLTFKMIIKDKSSKAIIERCIDNVYKISASKMIYDKKKKSWYLNLCYSFENGISNDLNKDKILGVDLGIHYAVYASVYGDWKRFSIEGGEINAFRNKTEKRRISMKRQGKYCGEGRIGHGRDTRTKPALNIGNKIELFRDTTNHKYSKALVDYAVKNQCGVIQMEDLSGISKDNKFLKNWSYFDLQTKIETKAQSKGIEVVYVNPKYTSQRCSRCGYIDKENRKTQEFFLCQKCGYNENADYNASQNIGIKDIDTIIANSK